MKPGFLNDSKHKQEGVLRDPRSATGAWGSRSAASAGWGWGSTTSANDRLGSATGVPTSFSGWGDSNAVFKANDKSNVATSAASTPWKTTTATNDDKNEQETDNAAAAVNSMEEESMVTDATVMSTEPSIGLDPLVQTKEQDSKKTTFLKGQPFLPSKTMGVPKNALDVWYSQELKTRVLNKDCYFSWHDNGMPHERRYTSIFVCPLTGEVFSTGKYGPAKCYVERKDPATGANVVWYHDKAGAEHGAAARAYDCFSLRKHKPLGMRGVCTGDETAYMKPEDAPPLPSMSNDVQNKMEAQRRLVATRRVQSKAQTVPVVPKNALMAWYTKRPRCHQLSKDNYVSWHDHGMPHLLKFTSVFVCPLSGEIFSCGRHGSSESYEERTDSSGCRVVWYNKKIMAEHAAAARAYDCWCFRLEGRQSGFLGEDEPYASQKEAPPLPIFPPEKLARVEQLQREASLRAPISMEPAPPMPTAQETQADRDEYRAARRAEDVSVLTMDESED